MKKFARIVAIILLAGLLLGIILPNIVANAAQADADLWVDPVNGKDSNNGTTEATALKTIQAAKTKAASLSASGDVVVILKGGVYDATSPIVFSASDSGQNGNTITYRAAEGEEVLISGGQKLTDWTLYDAQNNIYVADIPASAKLTRQFYVDSEPQPLARLENSPTDWAETTDGLQVPEKYNFKALWYPEHVEMNTLYLWYHRVEHFTGINSSGTVIYEDTGCLPTWVSNDYLFIDRAGEWYIDRYDYKIYYKANGTMDGKEAYLPVTEQVIELNYASNITFEGITFSHTSYTHTSENRYLDQQANGHYYDNSWHQVPAGVEVTGCTGITFDGCDIRNMGTAGIRIRSDESKMADGNKVINSRIYDVSYSGIIVGEIFAHHGYESFQLVKNTTIQNNLITRIGIDIFDSPGITATYTNGTIIDHNEISYCPYSGISIGWGWSNEESENNTAFMNEVGNNQITNNYIHDVCKTNYDGGAFYSLGMSKGSVVSGNYIYNSGNGDSRGEISIYLDEGSSYMEVCNNVVGGQSAYWQQMYYSNIHDNNWHDNFYDASIPSRNNGKNNTVVNNTAVSGGDFSQYPAAMEIINNAGLLDETLKEGMWEGFIHQHDIVQAFWPGSTDRYIEPTWGWDNVSVAGQVGRTLYDSVNGTISIVVKGNVDISNLALTFDLYEGWSCDKASGSTQDFTNPVTYTLESDSAVVRWVVTVNQQADSSEEIEGTEVDLKDAFTSGSDWTSAPSSVSGGVMTHSGYSVYIGEKFAQDSIFEFDLKIDLTSTSEWVAFTLKNQDPDTMCINGGTEYYIGFNTDDVEVQKFVNGQRYVFFGEIDGTTATYGALPNNFFTPGSFHSIRVGAINVDGGVRIFMFVDGNLVFDITDFSNYITNDGYFGVYGMTKSISLRAFTDTQNTPDTTELDAAFATANSINAADYTAESYANLQSAIEQANAILQTYGGATQEMVDEATDVLNTALDNLEKVQGGQTPTEPTTPSTQPTTAPTQPTTAPTQPATYPTVPVTGSWLDAIPASSITPYVGDYRNGDFTTLYPGVDGEEEYLTDAQVGTAGWIGTSGQSADKVQAVLFELNDTKTVGGVELIGRTGDYITQFDIQVRDTNGVWQTVKELTESPFEDSYTAMLTFDPVVGTAVRILVYDYEYGGNNNYPMLMEITVYEVKTGEALLKVPVTSVTANKSPYPTRHTVDKLFDGDKREGIFAVASSSLPVKIEVNLTDADGNPSNIARMKLFAYDGSRYTAKNITVEVQTAENGAWTQIYSGNAYNTGFTDTFVLDFEQAYDAYALRLTVNSTISDYLILPEVELYGYAYEELSPETNTLVGTSYSVRLIEPWALRTYITFATGTTQNPTPINLSEMVAYGAYAIIEHKFENAEGATYEDLMNDPDAIAFISENGNIYPANVEGKDATTTMMFDFMDEIYTFRLAEKVYWIAYYVDGNGQFHYTSVKSTTLTAVADKVTGQSGVSQEEKDVLAAMKQMKDAVIALRGEDADLGNDYHPGTSIGESGMQFGDRTSGYAYGTSKKIRLIEPWGVRVRVVVRDTAAAANVELADADDYGLIFYHDKIGQFSGTMTPAQILAQTDARIYSKSNGGAVINAGGITAIYDRDIFTHEMDTELYCLPYVVMDGKYYYPTKTTCWNLLNEIVEFSQDSSLDPEEIAVFNAMIQMHTEIMEYRAKSN